MQRTKKRIPSVEQNTPGRRLLISNVIAYNPNYKDRVHSMTNENLLILAHPLDRENLAKELGIDYYFWKHKF